MSTSFSLRNLPLPVKVVASVFLLAVGAGYTSAMLQLHMQDSKSGKPMPTVEDVIRKYTGKVKYDPTHPPPAAVSRLESLILADTIAISGSSMAAAFTTEDRAKGDLNFGKLTKGKPPEQVEAIKAERRGEQEAFKLWINTPEEQRKKSYETDRFEVPADQMPKAITPAFKDGNAIKIKSIIDARCVTCHSKGGEKEEVLLDNHDGLLKHMNVEKAAVSGDWMKVEEPISTTKLTQSTHAHLLSFAVLFSLTGVIFAFSSYPTCVRCILGPWVVLAVFADVSLWWLARLSDQWGPYFAMGIIATGGAAGLGLAAQIVLSLFNMYGIKGKIVLVLMFLLAGGLVGLVWMNKIDPALKEKENLLKVKDDPKKPVDGPTTPVKNTGTVNGNGGNSNNDKKVENTKPYKPVNELDQLLSLPRLDEKGQPIPAGEIQFNGQDKGSMVPAFFEKDKTFKKVMDDPVTPQAAKDKLKSERQAELDAALAWIRSADGARKAAYDTNSFVVPSELIGKVTTEFVKDGKVQIKSIIDARCCACHAPGKKQEDYPLTKYEELAKYLQPLTPAETPAPAPPAPAPKQNVEPIPDAKDD